METKRLSTRSTTNLKKVITFIEYCIWIWISRWLCLKSIRLYSFCCQMRLDYYIVGTMGPWNLTHLGFRVYTGVVRAPNISLLFFFPKSYLLCSKVPPANLVGKSVLAIWGDPSQTSGLWSAMKVGKGLGLLWAVFSRFIIEVSWKSLSPVYWVLLLQWAQRSLSHCTLHSLQLRVWSHFCPLCPRFKETLVPLFPDSCPQAELLPLHHSLCLSPQPPPLQVEPHTWALVGLSLLGWEWRKEILATFSFLVCLHTEFFKPKFGRVKKLYNMEAVWNPPLTKLVTVL